MTPATIGKIAAVIAASSPAAALAQHAVGPDLTVTGNAAVVSDYRFRGLSQTDKRAAIQAGATIAHDGGVYVAVWGSSIDDYVSDGADAEIDLSAGYRKALDGTTIDAGLLYYHYAGSGGDAPDFFEPFLTVAREFGPVEVKAGADLAWKQHGLATPAKARAGGAYVYGEASADLSRTGVRLTGHVGRSLVDNYITFGSHYTDWGLAAAYAIKPFTISAAYVDTNHDFPSYPLGGGRNRDISDAGFVGSVSVAF